MTEPVELFTIYSHTDEFGDVCIPMYCGELDKIRDDIMMAARREGFSGDFESRLAQLGWWLVPLHTDRLAITAGPQGLLAQHQHRHGDEIGATGAPVEAPTTPWAFSCGDGQQDVLQAFRHGAAWAAANPGFDALDACRRSNLYATQPWRTGLDQPWTDEERAAMQAAVGLIAQREAAPSPVIETCDVGHTFAALPDHPTKDGLRRCPHCMAVGLIAARREIESLLLGSSQAKDDEDGEPLI